MKPKIVAPAEEPDLLGLPKLSLQHSESFWSRLPFAVRIGAIAAVMALVVGGIDLDLARIGLVQGHGCAR